MTPGEQKDDNGAIWKGLILASFIMLSMLTWASSPLQKLVEKVQHKQTVKAKLIVCAEIRAMIPVYQDWTAKLFKGGCIWEAGNTFSWVNPDKWDKEWHKEFEDQEGPLFEETVNRCARGAADNELQNKITDRVATPLYFEKLDCPSILKEAEKLGIMEDR